MSVSPETFLRRHDMYYEQMPLGALIRSYREDMDAALEGRPATLLMLPSYIRADYRPRRGESVLVIDAGGTNLRAARAHLDEEGRVVVEQLRRRRMPGAEGQEIDASEMFRQIAEFALDLADCSRACISFSYVFDALPEGDGRIRALCKELRVRGSEGAPVCASLERALRELGAPGERRWRLINDSVGSLLGGMEPEEEGYADHIGFILGTGVNSCCILPSKDIRKDPVCAAMGGEMIVNMESGCFARLLQGTADRELDAASELPGDHVAEKMMSGNYYRQLLSRTLALAAREGALPPALAETLGALSLTGAQVDEFCLEPHGNGLLAATLGDREAQSFAAGVNEALLERAARVAAGCLCAVMERRALPPGSRVRICADGTMLRLNPLLLPRIRAALERWAEEGAGVRAEFRFVQDATLLGCVRAGLAEAR